MATFDIDTPVRINGGLTVNGDASIPSSNLNVGGNITGNIINANTINEGGVTLNSKYLGINSTAINSTQLNGINSNQFVRSDTQTNVSANIFFTSGNGLVFQSDSSDSLKIYSEYDLVSGTTRSNLVLFAQDDADDSIIHRIRYYGTNTSYDVLTLNYNKATFDAGVKPYVGTNIMWHAGNDGSGSGMDSDTVDGQHASSFAPNGFGLGTLGQRLSSGSVLSSITGSGWYDIQNPSDGVSGMTWHGILHNETHDPNYATQFAFPMADNLNNLIYVRGKQSGAWGSWSKVWTEQNMGSSSGLNADMVDSLQAYQFLRSDTNTTLTGGNDLRLQANSGSTDSGDLVFQQGDGTENARVYASPNTLTLRTGSNPYSTFIITTSGGVTYNSNQVWHSGNFVPSSKTDVTTFNSHTNSTGIGYHVPTGGSTSQFLRGDGTWQTVSTSDTYATGLSSTAGGNGTLTVSRNNGQPNLTLDLSHNHDTRYLGISGTAVSANNAGNSDKLDGNDSTYFAVANNIAGHSFNYQDTYTVPSGMAQTWFKVSTAYNDVVYLDVHSSYDNSQQREHIVATVFGYQMQHHITSTTSDYNTGKLLQVATSNPNLGGITEIWILMDSCTSSSGSFTVRSSHPIPTLTPATPVFSGNNASLTYNSTNRRDSSMLITKGIRIDNNKVWHEGNDGAGSTLDADTVDSIQGSQLVRNDTANQSVNTGFTMSGNAYVGMSNSSGAMYIRTGAGSIGIQLAGDNGAKQSGVGAYINASGTATFSGTMTANAIAVTSTSLVTNLNAQMVNGVKEPQIAKNQSVSELGGKGVYTGLSVSSQSVPNMTVQVGTGTVYTDSGMRVVISSGTSVSFATPSATYNRIDSVYIQGSSAGANEGNITVAQGTPSASPVAPSIPSDGVLLANVTIRQNAGSILATDITDMRLWKPLYNSGQNTYLNNILYIQGSLDSNTNGVIQVNKPFKSPANNSITIPVGSTSYTWTHNLNLSQYIIKLSCNSSEPHIYWSNKTTNAITVNLDDICVSDVVIDIGIEAF